MSGARGCFNCGGCAWCRLVFSFCFVLFTWGGSPCIQRLATFPYSKTFFFVRVVLTFDLAYHSILCNILSPSSMRRHPNV
ncbi:hypothetical protein IW262DRAFT_355479 [Armillaria fumosa]|nr:hypothetical protein IW262DRAFT_355479 [Armillaria fumosa]